MIRNNNYGKSIFIYLFLFVVLLGLAGLVFSLSFVSNPQINSGATVYTADDLNCSWQASADTTSVNVTWYKDGVSQYIFVASGNSNVLDSANTSKNQEWICEVMLINTTSQYLMNATTNVVNTLPYNPKLFNLSGFDVGDEVIIIEDSIYYFLFNASDDDGDSLTYTSDAGSFCDLVINENNGNVTCSPANDDLLNPHAVRTKQVSFIPSDGGTGQGQFLKVNFTLIPVNDQAEFETEPEDTSIYADTSWSILINGTDEEGDFPFEFTLSSGLDGSFPDLLILESYNGSVTNLTFNTTDNKPSNSHVGNWTVNINITDNASSNATRSPTQTNFNLEILTTNHPPEFTVYFNNTNGTQNQAFSSYIYANDSDSGNNITFALSNLATNNSAICATDFPWSITTINQSYLNATGRISMTLNNTHVACPYVNVTVSDQDGASESYLAYFNITNVNDIPEFFELGEDGNITIQSTYRYVSFEYKINASDIDNFTYDRDSTGTLYYFINDSSIFNINASTGIIYGNPQNATDIGNWSLNITVGDGFYNISRIMNMSVLANSPPYLNLSTNNFVTYQNNTLFFNFTTVDTDNNSMSITHQNLTNFNASEYDVTKIANSYAGGINTATWSVNLSRANNRLANDLVGVHRINITVADVFNASDANTSIDVLNFTILNTNDVPFFDANLDNNSDSISFGVVIADREVSTSINVTDYDFFLSASFANESINFSYNNVSSNITNVNLTKTGQNSATISFLPTEAGDESIIIVATDSNGSSVSQNVSFEVFENSAPPSYKQIKPFRNISSGETQFEFVNASLYPSKSMTINISENSTIVFDAIVENDTSIPSNNLTFNWYYDGILNSSLSDVNPGIDSNLTHYFGFFSNGTNSITLEAIDSRFSSTNWTWSVNVTNFNRDPVLINNLDNITVNLSTTFLNYFSYRSNLQRFYDADEDLDSDGIRTDDLGENTSLVYGTIGAAGCSFLEFSISNDDLSIVPSDTGICEVQFTANDSIGSIATSNTVRINVVGAEPQTGEQTPSSSSGGSSSNTRVVTVPFEEEVEVPHPIKLIAPGQVDTYVNKTIEIPIKIQNTWTEEVRGVSLAGVAVNATLTNEPNASITFTQNYFPSIPVGGEYQTILTLSNYRSSGPFEINVIATVNQPEFSDSVSILINSLEQTSEGDEVRTKVTFAKDMISENPECKELNELLDRADVALENQDYRESLNLVNAVINGCKYLITNIESARTESPSLIEVSFDFMEANADKIVMGAGIVTLLVIVIYSIVGIQKLIRERE